MNTSKRNINSSKCPTTGSTRTGNSAALHCQPVMRSVRRHKTNQLTQQRSRIKWNAQYAQRLTYWWRTGKGWKLTSAHNVVVFGLTEESWTKLPNVPFLLRCSNHLQHQSNGTVNLSTPHLIWSMVTDTMTTTIQSTDIETDTRKNLSWKNFLIFKCWLHLGALTMKSFAFFLQPYCFFLCLPLLMMTTTKNLNTCL